MKLIDAVSEEIARMVGHSFDAVVGDVSQDSEEIMLRRLRQHYGNMSLEELQSVQAAMGHQADEAKPCRVCRLMARKELELNED